MGIYFGTDGIRGKYFQELSPSLAFKCGNSLARFCKNKKVLLGKDTRLSGDVIALSVANGLMSGGVNVIYVGICPTPCVAYLCKNLDCDFGVMISASHNEAIYNGIKIFDNQGYKINEEFENQIERKMILPEFADNNNVGKIIYKQRLVNRYINHITKNCNSLKGLKIVLDLANGANYKIAKKVFTKLGANIICVNDQEDGRKINDKCGALHPEIISNLTKQYSADVGFCFDGDADRIIACDNKGNILDGDKILYILNTLFKNQCSYIVGTTMSNSGFENALKKQGVKLLRADVGDKYVIEKMCEQNILLGGEQSGHIIIKPYSTTGDGLLTAIILSKIAIENNKDLSKLIDYTTYPQININIEVLDKFRILNSEKLSKEILKYKKDFANFGRIIVRASGTEQKIRIMSEHKNKNVAIECATKLKKLIESLNQ